MALAINLDFLKQVEGNKYEGYVPIDSKTGKALGNSGVTIGIGVDLGQQTERDLKNMGLSPDTVRILKPYLGLKKEAAQAMLKKKPLSMSPETVDTISASVITEGTEKLIEKFR